MWAIEKAGGRLFRSSSLTERVEQANHWPGKYNKTQFCQDLLTIEDTYSDWNCTSCTMQMSYWYASDFPLKNFCKLAKQAKRMRNYPKQVLLMIWETHKLTLLDCFLTWVNFSLQNKRKSSRVKLARADKLWLVKTELRIKLNRAAQLGISLSVLYFQPQTLTNTNKRFKPFF